MSVCLFYSTNSPLSAAERLTWHRGYRRLDCVASTFLTASPKWTNQILSNIYCWMYIYCPSNFHICMTFNSISSIFNLEIFILYILSCKNKPHMIYMYCSSIYHEQCVYQRHDIVCYCVTNLSSRLLNTQISPTNNMS